MKARGLHEEYNLEDEICAHLGAHGWLYDPTPQASKDYDRERALYVSDLVQWVKDSQPTAWEQLTKTHGAAAEAQLLDRLRKSIDERGTLEIVRDGIELLGVRGKIRLAQFKPTSGLNPDLMERYSANRLRVIRQLRYALDSELCIDLGLFLNGIPVATLELKTDFTQSIEDAVDQYRFDRLPRVKGGRLEPLLSFPSGALVHFAVSNSEVRMTTKLAGPDTRFLPFNQGNDGAAGNPIPPFGYPTSYFWEEVLQRDSWLDILGRYMVSEKDEKGRITTNFFPRFHQLDVTRKLQDAILEEGVGGKYLIQHSAGSGKTNSIAWSAHFLSELHDAADNKLFSAVIVVSDRRVIDGQLQDAIFQFQRTKGVVETISHERGSKSGQLAEALAADKKIIVCTIQTFPFAMQQVRELAATLGKSFAVIADEAHSSQTGEAAGKLKELLSSEELEALADGGEVDSETVLAAQMTARADDTGITYIAFTATPKAKTMELFGRVPDPSRPAGPDNKPEAFHVYSMRQAIEEGFILDVLKNYTPYKLAFKLAHNGQEYDEQEVDSSEAMKGIMGWIRLHPYNISQKVKIVVEHFRENVEHLLGGRAKAMVVTASRKEVVRWKLAIDKYIAEKGYGLGTLVAFSGEVKDPESGPDPFTEPSHLMNPNLRGRKLDEAFGTDEFHILLVANKYQTGFDQPLLCAMYVDRRLAGIQAVQTLSRLNRAYEKGGIKKDTTYVLDFVNSSDAVLEAFQTYYETASLESTSDPNIVFDLRAKLDGQGYYDTFEVDRVVKVLTNPRSTQGDLTAAIFPVADRLVRKFNDAKKRRAHALERGEDDTAAKDEMDALWLFKSDAQAFIRAYTFLSQIFDYGSTDIEKRFLFFKCLVKLLEFGRDRELLDTSQLKLTHHRLRNLGENRLPLGDGEPGTLKPLTDTGSGTLQDKQKALLSEILNRVNDLFEGDLTEGDQLVYVNDVIKGKLLESEELRTQARNNSKTQFASSPTLGKALMDAIIEALDAHQTMSSQALSSKRVQDELKDILLGPGKLWEELQEHQE